MSGESVTFPSKRSSENADGQGVLFGSPSKGSMGVVLIHEWWGLDTHTKDMAQQIRNGEFVVLALDVFRGKLFTEPKPARENMINLDYAQAAMDVAAAAAYLKSRGCGKVAVVGCAFGASLALVAAATHHDVIDAVAPQCGVPKPEAGDISQIKCPVQGHYAAKDKVVGVSSPADYNPMAERLWAAGVPLEMCIYDAEHAFVNPNYRMYNKAATKEYFDNLFRFLNDKLTCDLISA